MTFKSPEKMLEIADYYSEGNSLNLSARKAGVANRTLHLWLKASREGDPTCEVEYLNERMQFARCLSIARGLLYMNMRSNFEARMLSGDREPVYFSGMPTFKPDPKAMALDEDTRELCGYRRDGLLEVNGALVQNEIVRPPPVAGVLAALAMWDPAAWTPSSRVETTANRTQGATVPPRQAGPPIVPPRPALPELLVLPDPAPDQEELLDLMGPEPEPAPVDEIALGMVEPPEVDRVELAEPEPAVRTAETEPALRRKADTGPMIRAASPDIAPTTRPISAQLASLLRR